MKRPRGPRKPVGRTEARKPSRRGAAAGAAVRIVAIGGSAGGLEAFERFLRGVPSGSGCAYVVVQHLDPTHEGMLAEILQRTTPMPVAEIVDGTRVRPDHVYVIPPNRDLAVRRGVLHLVEVPTPRGLRLPIDGFLRSLAADEGNRAVGVVLSGMGSDGTLGLREIRGHGGLTLVQDPTTAGFDGMPRSAIDAGVADVVGPPEALPARIADWCLRPAAAAAAPADEPSDLGGFEQVLRLLRARSGHDFTGYKASTVRRRIERRMGVHQLDRTAAYLRFLRANPQELDLLFKEMLIGVTSFFRDPAVWAQLGAEVLPSLLAHRPPDRGFRAWVPACSTGEEAYSLAIELREALDAARLPRPPTVQIFATDLDRDAIDRARLGRFPASIAADVPAARLARYFVESDHGYQVSRTIREMVVFAPHDALQDPPFTRLDLVSCRNFLIYLTPDLQQRLVPIFHYALRPGGHLLLGSAETITEPQGLFAPVPGVGRCYRRLDGVPAAGAAGWTATVAVPVADAEVPPLQPADRLQAIVERFLLQRYAPAAIVANRAGDIVHVHGRTGAFLEPAAGKADWNVIAMARDGLRSELGTAFRRAVRTRRPVTSAGLAVGGGRSGRRIDLVIEPLEGPAAVRDLFLVVFADTAPVSPQGRRPASGSGRATATSRALASVTEELRVVRAEAHAAQVEARAAGEELQAANEELQSTNEELTTSKEEMQSMNEELQTLNQELQAKVDDLSTVNNDLKNLVDSAEVAIVFLDTALCVRRFTAGSARVFRLIPGDVGRPITDIASGLAYPSFADDARAVLATLAPHDCEVAGRDARWFHVRIVPYRTLDNVIDGVSVIFTDITERRRLELALASARAGAAPAEGRAP